MEFRHLRFDDEYRWLHAKVQPLKESDGDVIRWYALLTDINDRQKAEESLRAAQRKLAQTTEIATAAGHAASSIHEICQPFSAMVLNAEAGMRWLSADPPKLQNVRTSMARVYVTEKTLDRISKDCVL
jgi:phosphoglycerate-specific signal transduction histidine kinase